MSGPTRERLDHLIEVLRDMEPKGGLTAAECRDLEAIVLLLDSYPLPAGEGEWEELAVASIPPPPQATIDSAVLRARQLIEDLVRVMIAWGNEEDGTPVGAAWEAYARACLYLGWACESGSPEPSAAVRALPEPRPQQAEEIDRLRFLLVQACDFLRGRGAGGREAWLAAVEAEVVALPEAQST